MPASSRPSGPDSEERVNLLTKNKPPATEKTGLLSDSSTNSSQSHKTDSPESSRFVLLVTSFFLLSTSVLNSVFFKKMTNSMVNNAWFLSQLSTVVYVPVFFGLVYINRDRITPEMRNFPKFSFFLMGAFDALSGLLSLFGGVHTSGSLQALLSNAIIPFTMGLSYLYLGQRFTRFQISGATVIMLGVAMAMVPCFLGGEGLGSNKLVFVLMFFLNNLPSAVSSVYKDKAFAHVDMEVNYLQAWVALWQLLFGFALIPFNTLSILGADRIPYSEMGAALVNGLWCLLGYNRIVPPRCRLNVAAGGTEGASYMLLAQMAAEAGVGGMSPASALATGTAMGMAADTGLGGVSAVMGSNTTALVSTLAYAALGAYHGDGAAAVSHLATSSLSAADADFLDMLEGLDRRSRASVLDALPVCDHCPGAWLPVTLYLCINMLYNYFMVLVISQSGSSWLYVIMTLRLPLVQLAFSIPAINNPPDAFGLPELLGLTSILVGLALYKLGDAGGEEGKEADVLATSALSHVQGAVNIRHQQVARERSWSLFREQRTVDQHRLRYYQRLYGSVGALNTRSRAGSLAPHGDASGSLGGMGPRGAAPLGPGFPTPRLRPATPATGPLGDASLGSMHVHGTPRQGAGAWNSLAAPPRFSLDHAAEEGDLESGRNNSNGAGSSNSNAGAPGAAAGVLSSPVESALVPPLALLGTSRPSTPAAHRPAPPGVSLASLQGMGMGMGMGAAAHTGLQGSPQPRSSLRGLQASPHSARAARGSGSVAASPVLRGSTPVLRGLGPGVGMGMGMGMGASGLRHSTPGQVRVISLTASSSTTANTHTTITASDGTHTHTHTHTTTTTTAEGNGSNALPAGVRVGAGAGRDKDGHMMPLAILRHGRTASNHTPASSPSPSPPAGLTSPSSRVPSAASSAASSFSAARPPAPAEASAAAGAAASSSSLDGLAMRSPQPTYTLPLVVPTLPRHPSASSTADADATEVAVDSAAARDLPPLQLHLHSSAIPGSVSSSPMHSGSPSYSPAIRLTPTASSAATLGATRLSRLGQLTNSPRVGPLKRLGEGTNKPT